MLRLSAHIVAETALWRVTSQVTGHKLIVISEDDANDRSPLVAAEAGGAVSALA